MSNKRILWTIGIVIGAVGGEIIIENSSNWMFWGILILQMGYNISLYAIQKETKL